MSIAGIGLNVLHCTLALEPQQIVAAVCSVISAYQNPVISEDLVQYHYEQEKAQDFATCKKLIENVSLALRDVKDTEMQVSIELCRRLIAFL